MEHAPGVLDKARGLIDKHRGTAAPHASPVHTDEPQEVPSLGELKNRCLALQAQVDHLTQTQQQMAQTVAELAEQNTVLIANITRWQSQLKWLIAGVLLVLTGCVVLLAMK